MKSVDCGLKSQIIFGTPKSLTSLNTFRILFLSVYITLRLRANGRNNSPNIVGATMLGVVACVLAVVCKRMPQQCWKSCANGSIIVVLRFGDHGTKEMLGVVGWEVWLVSNFVQQHATTSNNIQQCVQTNATCNIQQCWELLANKVASICTGLKVWPVSNFAQQLPTTRNNMQQDVQTDTTCNIQRCWSCWPTTASVCT